VRYDSTAHPPPCACSRGSSSAIRVAASNVVQPESDRVPAEPRMELPAIFSLISEAAKTGATFFIASSGMVFLLGSFDGFGGGAGVHFSGGGGGAGGGGGGGFWSKFFSIGAAHADDESSVDWDAHGLPVNMTVSADSGGGVCSSMVGWDKGRVEHRRRDSELTSR
jgi:hypothetical protein